jgi:Flp pilus assembly protein TadB
VTSTAALLAAAAVLAWSHPGGLVAAARLKRLASHARAVGRKSVPPVSARLAAAVIGGVGVAVLVGEIAGVVAGLALACGLYHWLSRLEPRAERLRRAAIRADVPVAADLLAACLLAGSSPTDAVDAVASAVEGPLAGELRRVVARLRLGGDPASSWLALTEEPALAALGWSLARAAESGGALAPAVVRIADEQRLGQRWAAEAAARRVSVRAAAPLGLCFLPAFVLIGIVPVVIGMVAGVTG